MRISEKAWLDYLRKLRKISDEAADQFAVYLYGHDIASREGRKAAIDFAYALATKYGEGAASLSCEMYDAVAEASKKAVPAAEPAETPTYGEVAKTVNGTLKQSSTAELPGQAIGRLVKRTGVDTTMKNAIRDGAEWAWIVHGDTCAFCITLASRGWQKASMSALKGGHAEHIHANCDCTYAIRFGKDTEYAGYDPDKYLAAYQNAEGRSWQDKVNALRRAQYERDGDRIREQKRVAYARKVLYNMAEVRKPSAKDAIERSAQMANAPENEGIIAGKVASGDYALNLKHQKYLQHTYGTLQYNNSVNARGRPQSYLIISEEEAQRIVYEKYGLGHIDRTNHGSPLSGEYITLEKVIGYYFHHGKKIPTRRIKIIYGKDGAHIIPVKEV